MVAVRENGATSGAGVLATYHYDDRGRRTALVRGNGTTTGYSYDAVSRLESLTHDLAGTANDVGLGYGYNPASQIIYHPRNNDGYSFTGHVNLNRADTVNGLNQVSATGGTGVTHDGRGNVSAIGSASYVYTAENRLTAAPGSEYYYDPMGRLWIENSGTTAFVYDGLSPATESDAVYGNIRRRYVPGPGLDEPVVWYEGSGTSDRRWFHADERGSVMAVSDGGGNLVGTRNRYDEYGIPQGALTGRFGYTGQMWLPLDGLYHYRNRAYSPALGRFMQPDPIGYGGGINLYAYVGNDPVNGTDPSGLAAGGTDLMCTGTRICNPGQNGVFGVGTTGYIYGGELAFERRFMKEFHTADGSFWGKSVSPWQSSGGFYGDSFRELLAYPSRFGPIFGERATGARRGTALTDKTGDLDTAWSDLDYLADLNRVPMLGMRGYPTALPVGWFFRRRRAGS